MSANGRHPTDDLAATAPLLCALSLRELEAFDFPETAWSVDHLIPAGALVLCVGRPKAGKSLLAIDLAASVALGEPFLDRATTQGPVILVPAEDSLGVVRDRLWTRLGSEREAPLAVLPVDGSLPQRLRIDDPVSFAALAQTISIYTPRLLALDPMVELHRVDENSSEAMSAVLRPLRQLAHETGTSIFLCHHTNKHATDPSHAVRGSSAIAGSVDVVITLRLKGEDGDGDGDAELTPSQVLTLRIEGRYGPRQRLSARLGSGLRWQAADAADDDRSTAEMIRRHLEATGDELTAEALAEAIGSKVKTVQNNLTPLVTAGRITRVGPGTRVDPFRYAAGNIGNQSGTTDMVPPDGRVSLFSGGITGHGRTPGDAGDDPWTR